MKHFIISLVITVLILIFVMKSKDEKISKNFNLSEFTKGGLFIPSEKVKKNIADLVNNVLQPLRDFFNKPVIVTSGYRPEWYNNKIGGSPTSEHLDGSAADIKINGVPNDKILLAIRTLNLPVNQVIDEVKQVSANDSVSWVHVSHNRKGENRKQFLIARNDYPKMTMNYENIG